VTRTRRERERSGRSAETLACWWLRFKGWGILARRVRTPLGEVDIVARRRRVVAFVEVKARTNEREAALALDEYRLRRVAAAAGALAHRYAREGDVTRIDAIFVLPRRFPKHMENVWHG
jgi:putative endonuclease